MLKQKKFWRRNWLFLSFPIIGAFLVPLKMALEYRVGKSMGSRPSLTVAQASHHNEYLKRYHLGFQSALAGLIWIQLLQESTLEPIPEGKVSWEFTQVDAVTQLDPGFNRAYTFGSVFLSVFKMDKLGAKKILERWVSRNPNYWRAHYMLGYHLYNELKDFDGGAKHILKAASMGDAPSWLSSLGVRLMSETGALAQSLKLAIDLYPGVKNDEGRSRLLMRIRSLNFALQKHAWNSALKNYVGEANRSPASIDELKPLVGIQFRELANIVGGEGVDEDLRPTLREVFPFRYNAQKKVVESPLENSDRELSTGIRVHADGK